MVDRNVAAVTEVRQLHADLAEWMGSTAAPEVFTRFTDALHPGFTMVTTSGSIVSREELLVELRDGNLVPGMAIDVESIDVLTATEDVTVVRFLETHRAEGRSNQRRVTAVLLPQPAARHGLCWRSVHETAIAQSSL
jgi:hypothetical protein